MIRLMHIVPAFLFCVISFAQDSSVLKPCPQRPVDSLKPIPYTPLREADVMWSKRVWRTIDLREKVNHPLYYPLQPDVQCRKSMFDVIKMALLAGKLTAYGNPVFDDEFTAPMTLSDIKALFFSTDTQYVENIETGELEPVAYTTEITSEDIKQYWIKEDWFFDRQRSVMDVRIVSICPLKEKKNERGEMVGYSPLFWIYYPEARPIFAREEVYNRHNAAENRSLDAILQMRQFGSYIHKESNVYDRYVSDYKIGLDALLESERIKEDIANMEYDLWHY